MAKPQGRCVFCSGTGLTKQHIWPDWMKKINQPEVITHIQATASLTFVEPRQPRYSAKRHQGHSGTRFARKVCKTCNNGWIERLEERVREPVTQLMQGEPLAIVDGTQRALAAWMTLVMMMVEFTDMPTLAATAADYDGEIKKSTTANSTT